MGDHLWRRVEDEIVRRDPKQARRAAAWLAAKLGISIQAVTNWKSRGVPASQHEAIARALEWSIDQLLGLQPERREVWPFETVAHERFARLTEREKGMVEAAMLEVIDRIEFVKGAHPQK